MTEGWLEIWPTRHARSAIEVDRANRAAGRAGQSSQAAGGKLFCQLMLSALELDDTRKPSPYGEGPRRFRFSIFGLSRGALQRRRHARHIVPGHGRKHGQGQDVLLTRFRHRRDALAHSRACW